jgi:hypothetical protein
MLFSLTYPLLDCCRLCGNQFVLANLEVTCFCSWNLFIRETSAVRCASESRSERSNVGAPVSHKLQLYSFPTIVRHRFPPRFTIIAFLTDFRRKSTASNLRANRRRSHPHSPSPRSPTPLSLFDLLTRRSVDLWTTFSRDVVYPSYSVL